MNWDSNKYSHKKVLIFGAGGHGVESIIQYIFSRKSDILISYLPVDNGGNTGTITRVFELNGSYLNNKLHKSHSYTIFPFGDLNKLIDRRFQNIYKEYEHTLCLRSDKLTELQIWASDIADICLITSERRERFLGYIAVYQDFYYKNKHQLEPVNQSLTCIGNLWQQFIFFEESGMIGLNRFYHELGLIPATVNIDFTYHDKQTLIGSRIDDEFLIGEDKIDVTSHAVLPYSLKLVDDQEEKIHQPVTSQFLEYITAADLIIIPNGSIANWISLINSSQILQSELRDKGRQGKLVLIANLFYSGNEFPLETYLELLIDNYEIPTLVLGANQIAFKKALSANKLLINKYKRQYKTANTLSSPKMNYLLKNPYLSYKDCLELVYGEGVEGIKYQWTSISQTLEEIFPSIK